VREGLQEGEGQVGQGVYGRCLRTRGGGDRRAPVEGVVAAGRPLVRLLQESGCAPAYEGGEVNGEPSGRGLTVGGEQTSLRAGQAAAVPCYGGDGGRQLSMLSMGRGVERKQLVTHLWTRGPEDLHVAELPRAGM
jgi:hypothetical protein